MVPTACTLSPVPVPDDCFLSILEQVRVRYRFVVVGYVVMRGFAGAVAMEQLPISFPR
jgi:hypothetical protein